MPIVQTFYFASCLSLVSIPRGKIRESTIAETARTRLSSVGRSLFKLKALLFVDFLRLRRTRVSCWTKPRWVSPTSMLEGGKMYPYRYKFPRDKTHECKYEKSQASSKSEWKHSRFIANDTSLKANLKRISEVDNEIIWGSCKFQLRCVWLVDVPTDPGERRAGAPRRKKIWMR